MDPRQRLLLVLLAVGFPVALILSWLFELTPEGVKLTRDVTPETSITHETGQRRNRVLIGMIGLLIVVLIADNWLLPARQAGSPAAPTAAAPTIVTPVLTSDRGFFTLMNLRTNPTRDPVLEQPNSRRCASSSRATSAAASGSRS